MTVFDLETIDECLEELQRVIPELKPTKDSQQIIRPGASAKLFSWERPEQPHSPKHLGFRETITCPDAHDSTVQVPGALPLPEHNEWATRRSLRSLQLQEDGEPVVKWFIRPLFAIPRFSFAGGVTRRELRRMRRKLRCYSAPPDVQRRRFRSIESDDPDLAQHMLAECELLSHSFTSPDALLRDELTKGRLHKLQPRDVAPALADGGPEMRRAILRHLGSPDSHVQQ